MCWHMPYLYHDEMVRKKRKFEEYVLWFMSLSTVKQWEYVNSAWALSLNAGSLRAELIGVPMPSVPDEKCEPLWRWPEGNYSATCSLPRTTEELCNRNSSSKLTA